MRGPADEARGVAARPGEERQVGQLPYLECDDQETAEDRRPAGHLPVQGSSGAEAPRAEHAEQSTRNGQGKDGGTGARGRGDSPGAPQVFVVSRSKVEVGESQCGEREGPDPDQESSPGPERPLLGPQFEGDLLRRLVEMQEPLFTLGLLRCRACHGISSHRIGGRGSRSSPPPGDRSSGSTGSLETRPAAHQFMPEVGHRRSVAFPVVVGVVEHHRNSLEVVPRDRCGRLPLQTPGVPRVVGRLAGLM